MMAETMSEQQVESLLHELVSADLVADVDDRVHVVAVSARSRRPLNWYSVRTRDLVDPSAVLDGLADSVNDGRGADVVLYTLEGGRLVSRDLSVVEPWDGAAEGFGACGVLGCSDCGAVTVRHLVWGSSFGAAVVVSWAWFLADLVQRVASFGGAL